MTQEELNKVLELHKRWINNEQDGERANLRNADLCDADLCDADLCDADLCDADLRNADLRNADLFDADLFGANLRNANLDYSCLPLRCGSLDMKVDSRIAAQIAYHFCRLDCDDEEYINARNSIIKFANKFHRANECGVLTVIEAKEKAASGNR